MGRFCEYWTDAAIDCYERGCRCRGCVIHSVIGNQCKMKYAVMSLVRQFGKPPEKKESILPCIDNSTQKVVDAILSGANTKSEISEKTGTTVNTVQNYINILCQMVQAKGYRFKKRVGRLPELIEILKELENDTRNE